MSLPPGGLPWLLSWMKVPCYGDSPQLCPSLPSGDPAVPASFTVLLEDPWSGHVYVFSPLCPCDHQKSWKKWKKRRARAHWDNLTVCLSHITMESPPSIRGAAFQGISWWKIFNCLQEMLGTESLCKDMWNSCPNWRLDCPPSPSKQWAGGGAI